MNFDLFISQFVIDEVKAGDSEAAKERVNLIKDIPDLEITDDVIILAQALIVSRTLPAKAATDAAHIAVSAVHGIDFLMTWNCVHLANAFIFKSVVKVCNQYGHGCPVICTPEELLGK